MPANLSEIYYTMQSTMQSRNSINQQCYMLQEITTLKQLDHHL